jgi:hypothetical protein
MQMGFTEQVVGLEVLQSLVKISLWIAIQPTGRGCKVDLRLRTTWLWLRKKKKVCFGFVDFHYETTAISAALVTPTLFPASFPFLFFLFLPPSSTSLVGDDDQQH